MMNKKYNPHAQNKYTQRSIVKPLWLINTKANITPNMNRIIFCILHALGYKREHYNQYFQDINNKFIDIEISKKDILYKYDDLEKVIQIFKKHNESSEINCLFHKEKHHITLEFNQEACETLLEHSNGYVTFYESEYSKVINTKHKYTIRFYEKYIQLQENDSNRSIITLNSDTIREWFAVDDSKYQHRCDFYKRVLHDSLAELQSILNTEFTTCIVNDGKSKNYSIVIKCIKKTKAKITSYIRKIAFSLNKKNYDDFHTYNLIKNLGLKARSKVQDWSSYHNILYGIKSLEEGANKLQKVYDFIRPYRSVIPI